MRYPTESETTGAPAYAVATVSVDNKGQVEKKTAFYVRVANGTKELDDTEKQKYVASRWSHS